jgi:deoxyribonuclease V
MDDAPPPDLAALRAEQQRLAATLIAGDAHGPVRLIGGVDISSTRFDPEKLVHAAVVVLTWPGLEPVAEAAATQRATLPYIPGFLGFREVPALRAAWDGLAVTPDLVMVDGHGTAHPRGLGIAAHLGALLDIPTIGVAKSPLVGRPASPVPEEPGAAVPLLWKGVEIGTVLRTRRRSNPLYLSPGHRVAAASAVAWVRQSLRGYRLPEPTRRAHLAANAERRRARGIG